MTADLGAGTGLLRTGDHRYYWNDQGPLPGVTTVCGVLDKSGPLMGWAAKQVAIHAVKEANKTAWRLHDGADPDAVIEWLSKLPERKRDAAADRGVAIHHYAELIGLGRHPTIPTEVWPSLKQYLAWRQQWPHEVLEVEYQGINLTHGYGGTGDLIVRKDNETWALDIKSGKYYDETALQLVGCARFEFIGTPYSQDTRPVPPVDRYGVLDLKDDGWQLVPYRIDPDAVFDVFAHLCAVYHGKSALKGAKQWRSAVTGAATEDMFDVA